MNTRLSQQVRGKIADHVRHLATEHGIAVVTVPARNTSKHCPQCLTPLRHCKAPDQPAVAGWKWAICPNQGGCGWQGDRDHGAWRRIAARGLTHQAKTVTDKTSGAMVIRTVVDTLEAAAVVTPTTTSPADRSKTGPTGARKTSRPAPRRRRAPSPTRPTRSGGQASGGTRTNGPAPAAPRSPPAPERDHDQHTHHRPPTERGSARRGIPLPRPRHPAQVGNDPGNSLRHRIA